MTFRPWLYYYVLKCTVCRKERSLRKTGEGMIDPERKEYVSHSSNQEKSPI